LAGIAAGPELNGEFPTQMFASEFLSRDEALSRFMTPLSDSMQNTSVRLPNNRMVTLGSAGTTFLYRPSTPFLNHQIREEYSVDHITGIASDLEKFGQLQECGIAAFTSEDKLHSYLGDSNEFYGTSTDTDDINRISRLGLWVVTVYGHNRQLAAASLNLKKNGHPDRGIQLRGHIHFDPTFLDFLHMQAVENTGQHPQAWSRARSMSRMLELGIRDGVNYSFKDIAECYGVDEDQVWRAHNYVQLPKSVQTLVEENKLAFSGAIELRRLVDIYAEQDVLKIASEASRKNWSAKQVAGEVAKRVNIRSLPPEFQVLVEHDDIKPKQAELIQDMHLSGASDVQLRHFIMWIMRENDPPTLDEIRQEVAKQRSVMRGSQSDLFSVSFDDESAKAQRDKLAASAQKTEVSKTISAISGGIATLKHLIENGGFVDIIDQNPIAEALKKLDEQHIRGIDGLATYFDYETITNFRNLIAGLNGNLSPHQKNGIEAIYAELDELLRYEQFTDVIEQGAKIQDARRRLGTVFVTTNTQEAMF
jgi:hypothetical protein